MITSIKFITNLTKICSMQNVQLESDLPEKKNIYYSKQITNLTHRHIIIIDDGVY